MSQVQADYTASLAEKQTQIKQNLKEQSGVKYQGITVKQVDSAEDSFSTEDEAVFTVEAPDVSTSGVSEEITWFAYCNGDYTAIWNMTGTDKGWKVKKVEKSTSKPSVDSSQGEDTTGNEGK